VGDGSGLWLPLFGRDENQWDNTLRVFLYLFGLAYCFMGVAVVADVFMSAIEKVTSKKRRVMHRKTGKMVTMMVWNPTVANLTLMALGSSAPEILLNVIFIFADGYFQEGLGPSTIVGSAAFNLFCISAVCVVAIPPGQSRTIKELPVYCVTAFFSVFAYLWLLFILMGTSPNIVEVWEGVLTFLFFPLLVTLAFIADRGYFTGRPAEVEEKEPVITVNSEMTKQELAALETKIRKEHDEELTDAEVLRLIELEHQAPTSRAQYRVRAIRKMTGGRRVETCNTVDPLYNVVPTNGTSDDRKKSKQGAKQFALVEFVATNYTVLESVRTFILPVRRRGNLDIACSVIYKTKEGTAKASTDYKHVEGTLDFGPGETQKFIEVPIVDDVNYETEEDFFVELHLVDNSTTMLGDSFATVVIIDDDKPGVLSFDKTDIEVPEATDDVSVSVKVNRIGGGSGRITCKFYCEDDSAIADFDYVKTSGELVFEPGQMSASFEVMVKAKGRYESSERFRVVINEATGGAKFDHATDGGTDRCISYITITPSKEGRERVDRMMSKLHVNWGKAALGQANWVDQFKAAIYVNGGDADADSQPGTLDYTLHLMNLPWKLLCACIPPPDFCDGWVCFCASLAFIGVVTAIIGDLAGLLGCCLFGPGSDGITAITFVACGTSLPDTFASKTAAQQDPYADASIGNITGSNSVNVFLGLGLPWMIAAIYWAAAGPNEKWIRLYWDKEWARDFRGGALVVEDPGLANSVATFSACAIVCMATLLLRRKKCDGELGGPRHLAILTAVFFVCLWIVFVVTYVALAK